jgi:hypothetical protein
MFAMKFAEMRTTITTLETTLAKTATVITLMVAQVVAISMKVGTATLETQLPLTHVMKYAETIMI